MKNLAIATLISLGFFSSAWGQLKISDAKNAPLSKKDFLLQLDSTNEVLVKIKNQRTLERGGGVVNGGGGASAKDPLTGQRRLLDLIEKDEVDFFTPDFKSNELFLNGKSKWYGEWINHAIAAFNAAKINIMTSSNLMIADEKEKIAEAPFLYTLMRVLDNENLWQIDENGNSYNQDDSLHPYRKTVCNFQMPALLKWAFTDTDLAELKDEGQISYENEKTKKQVAVQINGLVVISRQGYLSLDQESKTALFLHEAVLRTVIALNPQNIAQRGTQDVRTLNRRLFRYFSESSFPAYPVLEAYKSLKISPGHECKQFSSKQKI